MFAAISSDLQSVQASPRLRQPRPTAVADPLVRRLHAGQHLFFEADTADFIYKVRSGVLRMTRMQKDGRRQVIAFGFPGDLVGLPCAGLHTTECDAITPAEVMARRYDATDRTEDDADLQGLITKAALDEIRSLQDHFLILGRRLANEKVAAFLALLLARIGAPIGRYQRVLLPMSRVDIADYLGLTPETVSRCMTQLRTENVIALDDANTVIVRDAARLRALAEGDAVLGVPGADRDCRRRHAA